MSQTGSADSCFAARSRRALCCDDRQNRTAVLVDTEFGIHPPGGGLDAFSLEQFDGSKGDCPNARVPYLLGLNTVQRRAILFRPRCKMWSCPVCGPANAWVWSFRANDGAHSLHDAGATLDFLTITPHERLSPSQSWWVAPKAWMKLQARTRRAAGKFEYFAVPELHKSDKVHFHMIVTARLGKRWWKDNARECGFGYQNDVKEVWELGGVTGYMNKYLIKTLAAASIPKGTRRVRTSRGWPKSGKRDPPVDWQFIPLNRDVNLQRTASDLWDVGYEVRWAGSRSAWDMVSPPE